MPELHVDTEIIGRNTEVVAALLRRHGLALVGVTKGCLGEPRVAAAMVAGGAVALADTRDGNLRRLREALPGVELQRLHLPSLSEPFDPGDVTYVSSGAGAAAVAAAPALTRPLARHGAPLAPGPRRVMLQVETGDQREGVPEDGLLDLAATVVADPRLDLVGVATNYACFQGAPSGIRASVEAMGHAARLLRDAGMPASRVSGGNSSLLALLVAGETLPAEITELRCGEALLLGQEALFYRPLTDCSNACRLRAEVLEEYTKPARGSGRRRLVLGLGRQDLGAGAVTFAEPGLTEIGRSGDYLVVEVEAGHRGTRMGAVIELIPSYEALVAAFTSPYVQLRLR